MSEELKLCPRCRSKAILIKAEDDKRRQTNKIYCSNMPCISITRGEMFGVDNIVNIWNTRTDAPEIERLTQKIKDLRALGYTKWAGELYRSLDEMTKEWE